MIFNQQTAGDGSAVDTPYCTYNYDFAEQAMVVTPVVSYSAGYINSGEQYGNPVFIRASQVTSGTLSISDNGTYDVTNYASANVNVSGGGNSPWVLLATQSMGTLSTTDTTGVATGVTVTASGVNSYELLVVEVSRDTVATSNLSATTSVVMLGGTTSPSNTRNNPAVSDIAWNAVRGSRSSTNMSAYAPKCGIYVNSCSISSGTASFVMYMRYSQLYTGTINGTFTARVYGVSLLNLIGG